MAMAEAGVCAKRKYFALPDLIIAAVILLFVLLGVFRMLAPHGNEGLVAVVRVRGEVVSEISLENVEKPYELTVDGDEQAVLCISSSAVWFKESDCPDKLCVNTGQLTRAGQSAVCLPARISVSLAASDEAQSAEPDAVAG